MPFIQPNVTALGSVNASGEQNYLYLPTSAGGSSTADVASINGLTGNVAIAGVSPGTLTTRLFNTITIENLGALSITGGTGVTVSDLSGAYTVTKNAGGLTSLVNQPLTPITGSQNGTSAVFATPSYTLAGGSYLVSFDFAIPFSCATRGTQSAVYTYGLVGGAIKLLENQPLGIGISGGSFGYSSYLGNITGLVSAPGITGVQLQVVFTNSTFVNTTSATASISFIKLA
jgi:hypothetical protein